MELTGKAKEDFDKWLNTIPRNIIENVGNTQLCMTFPYNFSQLSESMQYGVYVDFFDSVGSEVYITNGLFDIEIRQNRTLIDRSWGEVATRHEARTKAIEKANEIYNSNNK